MLLREAAKSFNWDLNYGGIALMWRGGCIIRSVFLGNIKDAYTRNPHLSNLLLDDFFTKAILGSQQSWREVVAQAVLLGVPVPAFSSALSFYDGYRSAVLPANLLQVNLLNTSKVFWELPVVQQYKIFKLCRLICSLLRSTLVGLVEIIESPFFFYV